MILLLYIEILKNLNVKDKIFLNINWTVADVTVFKTLRFSRSWYGLASALYCMVNVTPICLSFLLRTHLIS